MEDFVARRTKTAEGKIALAEAQAIADVRSAAANAAVTAASTILSQSVKGPVADDLLAKGIAEVRAKAELIGSARLIPRAMTTSLYFFRRNPGQPGGGAAGLLFLATFGFGSGVSACGSKPI